MTDLKVFCHGDTDTIVAESIEDAKAVLVEIGSYMNDYEEYAWEERKPNELLLINFEDPLKDEWPEGASVVKDNGLFQVTAKIQAWAEWHGRGFLCSTEW